MPYEFPVDPQVILKERSAQFTIGGVPSDGFDRVAARITDMWSDAPGGWVYEWSELAREYADEGNHLLASLVYGIAKFPALSNEPMGKAYERQLEEYLAAAPGFRSHFERRIVDAGYRGGTTPIALHAFSKSFPPSRGPVLIASGGIDTWKMDLHNFFVILAEVLEGLTILAFDLPGTGETQVPLDRYAEEIIFDIVDKARHMGNGRVGHLGLSFGGNFSAMTGLMGAVDAAVVIGGPFDATFGNGATKGLVGYMKDVLGNACGFDKHPSVEDILNQMQPLKRGQLLESKASSPMLVMNGANDRLVAKSDTLIFDGRPGTEVHLFEDAGHCAPERAGEMLPIAINWLAANLGLVGTNRRPEI